MNAPMDVLAAWANDTTCPLDEANRRAAAYAVVAELIEAARHSTPHLLEELRAHDASGRQDYPNLFNALRPLLAAIASAERAA